MNIWTRGAHGLKRKDIFSEEGSAEMKLGQYRIDGKEKLVLEERKTYADKKTKEKKEDILLAFKKNKEKLALLQDRFYADGKEGIVFVIQAIDASGKDSLIRHACDTLNPQGVTAYGFKAPTSEELSHDYLWRIVKRLPERGHIAIFNRSHYEDVVTVKVNELKDKYAMADRVLHDDMDTFFEKRCRQIRDFEEYLYENSYRVVKVFLHVSKEEQKERFLERIDREEKNWKFNAGDLADRSRFNVFMKTYEDTINRTATKYSPWYVIPADNKWFTRYLFTEIMIHTIEECDSKYPVITQQQRIELAKCKEILLAEDDE